MMPVLAQTVPATTPKQAGVPAPPPAWFKKLDRDGSDEISREEMPKLFGRMDVDKRLVRSIIHGGGDGWLTRTLPCKYELIMGTWAAMIAQSTVRVSVCPGVRAAMLSDGLKGPRVPASSR